MTFTQYFVMPYFWIGILALSLGAGWAFLFKLPPLKKSHLAIYLSFFCFSVVALYHYWGDKSMVHLVALNQISYCLEKVSKQKDLSQANLMKSLQYLEPQLGYSPPALAHLGEIYLALGWHDYAINVLAKAIDLAPNDNNYRFQWIYAHSLKNQGKLPPAVREIAENLSEKEPQKSLINLLAIDDYFRANFSGAIQKWQRLLENDEELADERKQVLEKAIDSARRQLDAEVIISAKVSIAPSLREALSPSDTVFVFIKPILPGPPLAVTKLKAVKFPFTVDLGNKQSMLRGELLQPGMKVQVVAKISKSGDALDKQGDLQGKSEMIVVKSKMQIDIIINKSVQS